MKKLDTIKGLAKSLTIIIALIALNGCFAKPDIWLPTSDQQVISDYIAANKDSGYAEFNTLLENTGLTSFLAIRGPYTLFLPADDAFKAYYAEKGINGIEDLDIETQKNLVFNHLVLAQIGANDMQEGTLREKNALDDYMSSEFIGQETFINKKSQIIDRDIPVANGVVHQVDKVIDILSKSVYDELASNQGYSIFSEGLEITGIKDTLQVIDFDFGKSTARTRFTILAVADTTFNRFGINSIADLVNMHETDMANVSDRTSSFYQYMEYHCLNSAYYFNDFEDTKLYPILSFDNNVAVTVDTEDYKINNNTLDSTYTKFYKELSNIPAKNGVVHTVSNLLSIETPEATKIILETTGYFDIQQGDYFGKYYAKWYDGENTFKNIKWRGDFMQYYFKDHDTGELLNDDCLQMFGFFEMEIITPKIMKGSYSLSGNIWNGQIDYDMYVDGVKVASIAKGNSGRPDWGEYHWDTTEEHSLKVINTTWGILFWDTIELTPLTN